MCGELLLGGVSLFSAPGLSHCSLGVGYEAEAKLTKYSEDEPPQWIPAEEQQEKCVIVSCSNQELVLYC